MGFFRGIIGVLAVVFMASPALAITADISGLMFVRGIASSNLDGNDSKDDDSRVVDQRFRLQTAAALNENVRAVFGIEVDNVWGNYDNGKAGNNYPAAKQVGKVGSDAKGEIEIKHLYLDFNLPELQTNVKAGTQRFQLGRGLIIADDAAGLAVRTAAPCLAGNSLGFFWIKPTEGEAANEREDADYYHLQYDMKRGEQKIAPYVAYYDMGDGDQTLFFGLDYDVKFGALALSATAIANDWEQGSADGTGLALWGRGIYRQGPNTFSLEAAYYGDEDNGGNFVTLSQGDTSATGPFNNFSEIITGGRFYSCAYSSAQTVVNKKGAASPFSANYLYAKLGAARKVCEKSKVSAYYIYAQQAADPAANVDAITFGHEIDAYYDYEVVSGLTLTVGGGYLVADEDFGAGDDAWKLGSGLLYTF